MLQLKPPFAISARLMPGLRIGDGWISLEVDHRSKDSRLVYAWYFDIPAGEFEGRDLTSGVCAKLDYQGMFETLLAFLESAVEALQSRTRRNVPLDDTDRDDGLHLFPLPVVEWAASYIDEISTRRCDIEETEGLIKESK